MNAIDTTPRPVFVYGTLRPGQGNYNWSLKGNTTREVTATLDNSTMYSNGGFPYVLENGDDSEKVTGTLVFIEEDEYLDVMRSLDMLEGTRHNDDNSEDGVAEDTRNHYNRVKRVVATENGEQYVCWTYIPPRNSWNYIISQNKRVEGGDWVEHRNNKVFDQYRSANI